MTLKGNAVSPGIALGTVFLYTKELEDAAESFCTPGTEEAEQALFVEAMGGARSELEALIQKCHGSEEANIFEAHLEILEDEEIYELVMEGISIHGETAPWAVNKAYTRFISIMEKMPDPLIAARVADLHDVRCRVLRVLRGKPEQNLSFLPSPCVVVAEDLLPSDTATLDRKNVLGIITQEGGATSHTAIIANSYGIPAVVGVPDCTGLLATGVAVGLDALTGEVHLQPSSGLEDALRGKQQAHLRKREQEEKYLNKPAQLMDGTAYEVGVNIGGVYGQDAFVHCDFVGLFRTEFLYMENSHLPDEEEQYKAYRRVIEAAGGRTVTLRTLDIGGDKTLPYMELPQEQNPFLGLRALRLCFARPELLHTQLRAALRAASHGPLWIMLPMVGSIEDIHAGRAALEAAQKELVAEGQAIGDVKLGIMVEIPSIAAIADFAADAADFASIGTNDLCQYLSAADRMNPALEPYYQTFSPAMVRTLKAIIDAFNKAGKPISVCGEMAADPRGALLLRGLGLQKLSMDPARIAGVKAALAHVSKQQTEDAAAQALAVHTQADVINLLEAFLH